MTDVYTDVYRLRVPDGFDPPSELIAYGRKALSQLLEANKSNGLKSIHRRHDLPDGSIITVSTDGTLPVIDITPPPPVNPLDVPLLFGLWIPRGFVVWPAASPYPQGYGLPVIQSGADPYAAINLKPGLLAGRWTPGGPYGQVLITKDPDAGYPTDNTIQAPMHYSTPGPVPPMARYIAADTRDGGNVWLAFRPSFVDFVSNGAPGILGSRREVFAGINATRLENGLTAAYLWPRGFYRPAETLSYLMRVNGAPNPDGSDGGYPATYQTTVQRLGKDGDTTRRTGQWTELFNDVGTPQEIVTGWTPGLLQNSTVSPIFLDVGFAGPFAAAVTEERSQWLQAGRSVFTPADTDLPPISWDGQATKNLGWLTLPVNTSITGSGVVSDPSVYSMTLQSQLVVNNEFYTNIYQSQNNYREVLGRHVFCRGRVLGLAPNDGFVLGASVQALPGLDRLTIITHHEADQNYANWRTTGATHVLRTWFVDLPYGDMRLHPSNMITVWQGGAAITVPGLKYESLWSFTPDGTQAVALRMTSTVDQVCQYLSDYLNYSQNYDTSSGLTQNHIAATNVMYCTSLGPCSAVVLTLNTDGTANLAATPLGIPALDVATEAVAITILPHAPPGLPNPIVGNQYPLRALCADYINGTINVVYEGRANLLTTDAGVEYQYLAVGGIGAAHPSDLAMTLIGASCAVPESSFATAFCPQIMDVPSKTWVIQGAIPSVLANYATPYGVYTVPGPPSYQTGAMQYSANPDYPACMVSTSLPVRIVRTYANGNLVDQTSYAHPGPDLWNYGDLAQRQSLYDLGTETGSFTFEVETIPTTSENLQPFYATRYENTIYGYQLGRVQIGQREASTICNPRLDSYAAGDIYYFNFTNTLRLPYAGKTFSSFTLPETYASWFAEVVVV